MDGWTGWTDTCSVVYTREGGLCGWCCQSPMWALLQWWTASIHSTLLPTAPFVCSLEKMPRAKELDAERRSTVAVSHQMMNAIISDIHRSQSTAGWRWSKGSEISFVPAGELFEVYMDDVCMMDAHCELLLFWTDPFALFLKLEIRCVFLENNPTLTVVSAHDGWFGDWLRFHLAGRCRFLMLQESGPVR